MKVQYLGTAAAEGWPGMFCHCKNCEEARRRGGRDIRTRCQTLIDDVLFLDFPPDTYYHALQFGIDASAVKLPTPTWIICIRRSWSCGAADMPTIW